MKLKLVCLFLFTMVSCAALAASLEMPLNQTPAPSQWTLMIGGSGATTTTGSSESAFGLDLQLGRTGTLLFPIEGGLRQGISYDSRPDSTLLDSAAYLDATVLQYGKLDLFVGGNVGLSYGNTPLLWHAGPEGGLRFWLLDNAAIEGRVGYNWNLNTGASEDMLVYTLGVKIKF